MTTWRGAAAALTLLAAACSPGTLDNSRHSYREPAAGSFTTRMLQIGAGGGVSESVSAAEVAPTFFASSDAAPLIGRLFTDGDLRNGASPTVIIGYDFWQRRFAGAPTVIGTSVPVDGQQTLIVGVMARGFEFPAGAQAWVPRRNPG